MHTRDTSAVATLVIAVVLGALVGLKLQSLQKAAYEERVALDFRLAAAQRATTIREALIYPVEGLEVLRSFFEGCEQVDEAGFRTFVAPRLRASNDSVFAAYRMNGESSIAASHGRLTGEAALRAVEIFKYLPDDGKPLALILSGRTSGSSSLLVAARASTRSGERYIVAALMDLGACVESALSTTGPWGLPVSILDRNAPPRLLYFHAPRLDAAFGAQLTSPEKVPKFSFTEIVVLAGTTLDIRIDASPKYWELRRRYLYLVISPTVTMFAFFLALGLNALRRRQAIAEAGFTSATAKLERFFSVNLDLLCILDAEGIILTLNPSWETVLGYTCEELSGTDIGNLIHEDDLPGALLLQDSLLRGCPAVGHVYRLRTKGGDFKKTSGRPPPTKASYLPPPETSPTGNSTKLD